MEPDRWGLPRAKHSGVSNHWGLITLGLCVGRLSGLYTAFYLYPSSISLYAMFNQHTQDVTAQFKVGMCMHAWVRVWISGGGGITNLCPDESLKARLEVVDTAVVELGHLVKKLLVLDLKVFLDWSELLSGLGCGGERGKNESVTISSDLKNIPIFHQCQLMLKFTQHIIVLVNSPFKPSLVSFFLLYWKIFA